MVLDGSKGYIPGAPGAPGCYVNIDIGQFAVLMQDIEDKLDSGTHGLAALKALIDATEDKLDDPAHGLEALRVLLAAIDIVGLLAALVIIDTEVGNIEGKLDSGVHGLAALLAVLNTIDTSVGDPSGDTLISLAVKWGDIARSLDLILGNRWDIAGDLGTDITALIAALTTVDTEVGNIEAKLDFVPVAATFSYLNAGGEQTVFTFTPAADVKLHTIWLDLATLTKNTTIRLKHQIDGVNYRTFETFNWTTGMDDGVYYRGVALANVRPLQVSLQEVADEGADRAIPYYYAYEAR